MGGAEIKKDGGANGGAHFSKGKISFFARKARRFFLAPSLKFWAPPYGGLKSEAALPYERVQDNLEGLHFVQKRAF